MPPHDTRAADAPHSESHSTHLVRTAPVLLVHDIVRSAEWWRDRLGFEFDRYWGDPPRFVILHRDGQSVMLQQAPHGHDIVAHWRIVPQMWNVYFWVREIDTLYAELKGRGATIDYALGDKPYGVREFGVQDPNGYDIGFGEPREP